MGEMFNEADLAQQQREMRFDPDGLLNPGKVFQICIAVPNWAG